MEKHWSWQLKLATFLFFSNSSTLTTFDSAAYAQIIPDTTLGGENSQINSSSVLKLIEGGAIRDTTLFHSFLEFNVGESQQVYFVNPAGIANILTRVTGSNNSHIEGTLGVLGSANLFLINPNGIIFGANARLDIAGSFTATTVDSIIFDNYSFSAINPTVPPLLTINVTPGIQYGPNNYSREIRNQGILSVGQDLSLIGGNLSLESQLHAGKDLSLVGTDRVVIRDSETKPFIATAGANLRVQGNQFVDIFALNHPDSGLFSGGDMVLQSANPVGGDAHYNSGGSFRIEQLDGSLGGLLSPTDPVIRANGDVVLASYQGASLHILAGGKVEIPGFILVQQSDTLGNTINPTTTPTEANVTLSNGSSVTINGNAEPTVDIRAGTIAFGTFFADTGTPTSADITVGSILFANTSNRPLSGRVLLTNQYRPNPNLSGSIQIDNTSGIAAILAKGIAGGGSVDIDSKGSITINGSIDTSAISINRTYLGDGGDITLLAKDNITLPGGADLTSIGLLGGQIDLNSGGILSMGANITSNSSTNIAGSKGGDIQLVGQSVFVRDGAQLVTNTSGQADAGNIKIQAADILSFFGLNDQGEGSFAQSVVESAARGKGGDILVTGRSVSVNDGANILSVTQGWGDAGSIRIAATEALSFAGFNGQGDGGAIGNLVAPGAEGNGGDILVTADSISLKDGAFMGSSMVFADGNAGNLTIEATDTVSFAGGGGAGSSVIGGAGNGGNIWVRGRSVLLNDGAVITSSALSGEGNAGNLTIEAADTVSFAGGSGAASSVGGGLGQGGDLSIRGGFVVMNDGSVISSSNFGEGTGDAGALRIQATDTITMNSSVVTTFVGEDAVGRGGPLLLTANSILLNNGAVITSSTYGEGDAGALTMNARDRISLDNSSVSSAVEVGAVGNGNDININTRSLSLVNNAQLSASTSGQGNAGKIFIRSSQAVALDDSVISTGVNQGTGVGGNIDLITQNLSLDHQAQITAATTSNQGGNISLDIQDLLLLRHSSAISATAGTVGAGGDGGNITINAGFIVAVPAENSDITANAFEGRGGNINVTTNSIYGLEFRDQLTPLSDITASSQRGIDGTVKLNTLDVDPSRGLTELPSALDDPEDRIIASCGAARNDRFVVTGRGGLPEDPRQALRGVVVIQDWRTTADAPYENQNFSIRNFHSPISNQQPPIVEAQGWLIDKQGNIELVTKPALPSGNIPNDEIDCRALKHS